MLELALAIQALELVGWTSLWAKLKSDERKQILLCGKRQPRSIPILDNKLKALSGSPNKYVKQISSRVVKFARNIVNTQAFEHIVSGLINPSSALRSKLKAPSIVRVL